MNCRKAKQLLALYAGGDLSEAESAKLLEHVDDCPECAVELERLRQSLTSVRKIAERDQPDALPEGFEWQVEQRVKRQAVRRQTESLFVRLFKWRPQVSLAGVGLVLLLAVLVAFEMIDQPPPTTVITPTQSSPEVKLDELKTEFAGCMEGPYQLTDWDVPKSAGVVAIMHKPDPVNRPDVFVIDYCAESSRLSSYSSYPWFEQRTRRMLSRAGSEDNVYIAVCLLDDSSKRDRRKIEKALIKEYRPYFNTRKGV